MGSGAQVEQSGPHFRISACGTQVSLLSDLQWHCHTVPTCPPVARCSGMLWDMVPCTQRS